MKTPLRLAISAALTLLLVEAGFRASRKASDEPPPHADLSVADEWSWAQEHLRAGEARLYGGADYDPTLGWAVGPKFRSADGSLAAFGEARRPGVPRLVLVGDSFSRELGDLGPDFLPGWEIVNLAVQGYGTDQVLLRYQGAGVRYGADVAVFGFYLRDYFRMLRSFRGYAKPTLALDAGGELVVEGVPVISPEALLAAYRSGERRIGDPWRSWALDFVRERLAIHEARARIEPEAWRIWVAVLRRFRDDARAAGACPFLLVFPTRPEDYHGTLYETIDLRTREEASALGLPWLALAQALYDGVAPDERERLFSEGRSGHLSEHGRASAVAALEAALVAHGLDACRAPSAGGY
jgi:hypothetical protein